VLVPQRLVQGDHWLRSVSSVDGGDCPLLSLSSFEACGSDTDFFSNLPVDSLLQGDLSSIYASSGLKLGPSW
jgi:hypothetical protein